MQSRDVARLVPLAVSRDLGQEPEPCWKPLNRRHTHPRHKHLARCRCPCELAHRPCKRLSARVVYVVVATCAGRLLPSVLEWRQAGAPAAQIVDHPKAALPHIVWLVAPTDDRVHMLTSIRTTKIEPAEGAKILPHAGAWATLADKVREFDPDVVVLVARKMPRLMEALHLDLGSNAICVSDKAIPFVQKDLRNARVAIVDDVWNVGTTMLHARDKVLAAGPSTIRLFALSAKDMNEARRQGVNLILGGSLPEDQYKTLVGSVPRVLKLMAKPYDVDFPIIQTLLSAPI